MTNPNKCIKKQKHHFTNKSPQVKAITFPVVMYRCESWTLETECQRTDAFELVLEKILESPLDSEEIKPVNPKENQP